MLENKLVIGAGAMGEGKNPALQPLSAVPGEFWGGEMGRPQLGLGPWVSSPAVLRGMLRDATGGARTPTRD